MFWNGEKLWPLFSLKYLAKELSHVFLYVFWQNALKLLVSWWSSLICKADKNIVLSNVVWENMARGRQGKVVMWHFPLPYVTHTCSFEKKCRLKDTRQTEPEREGNACFLDAVIFLATWIYPLTDCSRHFLQVLRSSFRCQQSDCWTGHYFFFSLEVWYGCVPSCGLVCFLSSG